MMQLLKNHMMEIMICKHDLELKKFYKVIDNF